MTPATSARTSVPVILLSDPDADTRSIFAAILRHYGARVIEAENAARAIQIARQERITAAVTEMLYSDDGVSLTESLRATAQGIRVYVITTEIRPERYDHAFAAGAETVQLKPFSPIELAGLVLGGSAGAF